MKRFLEGKGGSFTMGAASEQGGDAFYWEKPAHSVTLSDYCIGKYEVTFEQFAAPLSASAWCFSHSFTAKNIIVGTEQKNILIHIH